MSQPISVDTEAATATAAEWRGYADRVEQHGTHEHIPLDQLSSSLADVYGGYVQAKGAEYQARQAAYRRVADRARRYADRLDGTRHILTTADDEYATRVNRVLEA